MLQNWKEIESYNADWHKVGRTTILTGNKFYDKVNLHYTLSGRSLTTMNINNILRNA